MQKCPHPQQQFVQLDRLDHIIINAELVATLFGGKVILCGHKENGNVLVDPAHIFRKFKAVNIRHHNIRDNEVEETVIHLVVGIVCVQAAFGLKTTVIQIGADHLIQFCVILQNKNTNHFASSIRAYFNSRVV